MRINFAPTQHDPLAQLAGPFTLHFTPDRRIRECYGERETGASIFIAESGAGRAVERVWPVTLNRPGSVAVTLTPVEGTAVICGAELEPAEPNSVAPSVVPRSTR